MLSRILPLVAALAFAPSVLAATADASSSLSIELLDVRDASGARVETGWFVFGEGIAGERLTSASGNAAPFELPGFSTGGGELGIGQSIEFGVAAGGSTFGAGRIEDALDGSLEVFFENFSGAPLEFSFRYTLAQSASARLDSAGEQAYAEASAALSDDSGSFLSNLLFSEGFFADGTNSESFNGTGIANFTLANRQSNLLFGAIAVDSFAVSAVPEPGAWAMLAAGLGLVAWRTRVRGGAWQA